MGTYYIAGPMSGYENYNYEAFYEAERVLRSMGYFAINPANLDEPGHTPGEWEWDRYVARDLTHLVGQHAMEEGLDGVVVLDGWEGSRGANLEVSTARTLGIPIYSLFCEDGEWHLEEIEGGKTILQEAQHLVYGERQRDYGHPADDYTKVAKIWSAILGHDVTPHQAALCMVGVKMSREANRPKRDNRVDIAGYAAVLDRIDERLGS